MSAGGLDWGPAAAGFDSNDGDSWQSIQSKRKAPRTLQQTSAVERKNIKHEAPNISIGKTFGNDTRLTVKGHFSTSTSHETGKKSLTTAIVPRGNDSGYTTIPPAAKNVEPQPLLRPPSSTKAASTVPLQVTKVVASTNVKRMEMSSSPIVKTVFKKDTTTTKKALPKAMKDESSIYDLMMFVKSPKASLKTLTSLHTSSGKDAISGHIIARKAYEINEEFIRHRFIPTKQKKKVFSKIKKRILMERLRNHMKRQAALSTAASDLITASISENKEDRDRLISSALAVKPSEDSGIRTISLAQFVSCEDISDDEEYEEIISNIKEIFGPFGALESIVIGIQSEPENFQNTENDSEFASKNYVNKGNKGADDEQCLVFLTFQSSHAAAAAATACDGSLSGGQSIIARLCSPDFNSISDGSNKHRNVSLISQMKIEKIVSTEWVENAPISSVCDISRVCESLTKSSAQRYVYAAGPYEYDLYLEDAVFCDDVAADDETEEVLTDLLSLCEVFGDISAVWIETVMVTVTHLPAVLCPCSASNAVEEETYPSREEGETEAGAGVGMANPHFPWLFLEYHTQRNAVQAAVALNGLCVGGENLIACLYRYDAYTSGLHEDKYCIKHPDLTLEGSDPVTDQTNHAPEGEVGSVIVVKYYISSDDLEECGGDGEELGAMKRDLLTLISSRVVREEGEGEAFVRRLSIVSSSGGGGSIRDRISSKGGGTGTEEGEVEGGRLAACVRYISQAAARDAMLSLDGTVLAGSRIRASVRESSHIPLHLSPPHPSSASVCLESYEEAHSEGEVRVIAVLNVQPSYPLLVRTQPAPSSITASCVSNSDETAPVSKERVGKKGGKKGEPSPVSVYKEAVLVPKLDKNIVSKRMIKTSDEEVDLHVKVFLDSIATFQEKLKEKDPIKAASKRRFVMGIKQATNCVRAGLVKLLLLAPDSEASEALEGLLDVLLLEAHNREVPVLYSLTRRKLGKAAHSSMKQVVIAVIDADGAYDHFKKILAFINLPMDK